MPTKTEMRIEAPLCLVRDFNFFVEPSNQ
jgi:hypothetical protein